MRDLKFTIMGAGHGGQTMAADLTLAGYEVRLFELEKFKANIEPIIEKGGIEHTGIASVSGRTGFTEISTVTTNIKEAIEGSDIINLCIPAYGHETHMNLLLPLLEDGQMVVIWPDNWGAIRLRQMMKEKEIDTDIISAGVASMLYACRRVTPTRVWTRRIKVNLRLSAFPRNDTPKVIKTLSKPWPGRLMSGENIFEVTMSNGNWSGHPPLMIFNACRIESDKGMFNLWKEGGNDPSFNVKSPSRLRLQLMMERKKVMEGFGLKTEYPPIYPPGHERAFLTDKELEEYAKIKIPGVPQQNPDYAPNTLNFRYITEDVPFGLVPLHHFGDLVRVSTPYTDATVTIAGVLTDKNYWKEGINPKKLGFGNLSAIQILKRL